MKYSFRLNNLKTLKSFLKLSFLIIILSSCNLLDSEIINDSSEKIFIEIQADEDMLKFYWSDINSYNNWVEKIVEKNKRERFMIDSQNFKINYYLYPTDTFNINPAIKYGKDTLYLINRITFIKNSDTLIVDDYPTFSYIFFKKKECFSFRLLDCYFQNE